MTTSIVPVTPADSAFEPAAALFDDYRVHYGRSSSPAATRAWLHEQIARQRLAVTAAVRDGAVRGFVTVLVMPAPHVLSTVWSIRDLYVAPSHRRAGIADTLLQHVVGEARAAGAHRVSLQTETGNVPALTLYTDRGFRSVAGLELLNLTL